jgi:hypothetical protein
LTPAWKNYVLPPDRFKPWPQTPPGKERRRFNPDQAVSCCVGLALSHTALEGDQHEYWFADLGTAPNPFGDATPPADSEIPVLESISPSYQCYPITTPVEIGPRDPHGHEQGWDLLPLKTNKQGAVSCFGLQPRAQGAGFNQMRPYCWEPLLRAWDATKPTIDPYRGDLGALIINVAPPYRGSVWAAITPSETSFYRLQTVTNCLHATLTGMKSGVFLTEGGTEFFTLFPGQQFTAGARVVNFSRTQAKDLSLEIAIRRSNPFASRLVLKTNFTLLPGETLVVAQDQLSKAPAEDFVLVSLSQAGTFVDSLGNGLSEWRPKPKPDFIEVRDGGLWLRGKPWKAHGVNYLPSSGIGLANGHYFEHWLGRGAYDPQVVARDLFRIKAMNLNAVSVFIYHEDLHAQHLLDFLRRCEELDLHVNLSLRPGTPMDFQWQKMKELIEFYRLAENDTVFAYDLAWEPSHGGQAQQQQAYAQLWRDWVLKRYGTLAAAEKTWGTTNASGWAALDFRLKSLDFSVPPMSLLTRDGPWRKLVADYRLFLDALLREKYSAARQHVHSIDPHHAVSFRMSCAALPYDFYGLSDAVDIWEPEAYGRIGDWDRVRAGDFTAAYARLCSAAKPLIWAEMGYSVWDLNRMAPDPEKLAFEGRYYADFYRMMIESGADGVFFWWYPGGFRLNERSDFGIINPDGTDRPATKIIRTEGPRFLKAPKPPKPDYWIAVDRDRDARGLFGIYQAVQADFWTAIAEDHHPALKWQSRPGTTK